MKKLILPLLLIVSLAACNKKTEDTTAPVVSVSLNHDLVNMDICEHEESNVIQVSPLDTIIVTGTITSATDLSQVKINIHDAGDCHTHERPMVEWSYIKIINVSGRTATFTDTIVIPSDAELHNHHMDIMALTENGVQSEEIEFNVWIQE